MKVQILDELMSQVCGTEDFVVSQIQKAGFPHFYPCPSSCSNVVTFGSKRETPPPKDHVKAPKLCEMYILGET